MLRTPFLFLVALGIAAPAWSQVRVLPLGDSITNGGQSYVSYRYELWFDLQAAGFDVDFVGTRNTLNNNSTPNAGYPLYFTQLDRDHDGYWGWRTDQIDVDIDAIAAATLPDIVLVHLGTNDVGQQGAAGVANADFYLREIIGSLRAARPNVAVLLAQVIDIGSGSGYGANAAQVAPLNAVIATIAADLTTGPSPVILVDQNTGFDLNTMMQSDELHPNLAGESQMADTWLAALTPILPPGNPPPQVELTSPSTGASFEEPASILLTATANDDGAVTEVRFYANGQLVDTDSSPPYETTWSFVSLGSYTLTAEADDDAGRTGSSLPVNVTVVAAGQALPIPIVNPSFELPAIADFQLQPGPGVIQGWTFAGTANTFTGIFNPPDQSYSFAGGDNPPSGADGANVAYLFNDGGPAESVSATQALGEVLEQGSRYVLTVAIGKFLPDQPYSFSTYGGYRIELLAGATVIASDVDGVDPAFDSFQDATCFVNTHSISPSLAGEPLSVRLSISASEEDRSTHFDDVRLARTDIPTAVPDSGSAPVVRVWPNPFNPSTQISWDLSAADRVSLSVWNLRGERVQEVFRDRLYPAGKHSLNYRPRVASGVYLLRLTTSSGSIDRKMTLLK